MTWTTRRWRRRGGDSGEAERVRRRVHFQHGRDGTLLPLSPERHVHHEGRERCWAQPENRAGPEGLEGEGPMHGCRLLQHDRLAHGAAGRHQRGENPAGFLTCSQITNPLLRPTPRPSTSPATREYCMPSSASTRPRWWRDWRNSSRTTGTPSERAKHPQIRIQTRR